jgi:hypothetical protein
VSDEARSSSSTLRIAPGTVAQVAGKLADAGANIEVA